MTQIPRAAPGLICPYLRKDMSKVCHTCPMWQRFVGNDPATGAEIDLWQCSIAMQAKCSLEIAKRVTNGLDGVQKATEMFRNEMSTQNKAITQKLLPTGDKQ